MSQHPLVLLVEDSEDDIALAERALRKAGHPHRLRIARDGRAAIDYLRSDAVLSEVPAVVLLDLKLPLADGKAVLRELRGGPSTARVPAVILSSSRLEQDILDAYALGANSYVQKPVDFHTFENAIGLLLTCWLKLNVAAGAERDRPAPAPPFRARPVTISCTPPPEQSAAPAEVLVLDACAEDQQATIAALRDVFGARAIVGLSSFVAASRMLWRVGGPPPLLDPSTPRLLFFDADLPDGDGRDLLQAFRYRCDHHVVIVVFARDPSPAFVSECYRLKVNSVVRKPTDPAEYRETVRVLGEYWFSVNERPPRPDSLLRPIALPG